MKAIVIEEIGGPDQLQFTDVDPPTPEEGQLVVDITAAGLNYIDTYHRSGLYPMDLPITPGVEGAGTVTKVGPGVSDFDVGDRVAWSGVIGSYAEQNAVPADSVVPVPSNIDLPTAAAVLLQGLTAHYLATDTFSLSASDKCLIHAGAGGVGLLLTQIAAMKGARVITTVGSHDKAVLSRLAGADDVVVYTETDFKDAVEDLVGERALDVVYDGVGAATFDKSIELLRPRGMMVTFGNASGPVSEISPLVLAQNGSLFLTRPKLADYVHTRDELMARVNDLFGWIGAGDLEVRIGAEYSLANASEAHRALQARKTTGKVLIVP